MYHWHTCRLRVQYSASHTRLACEGWIGLLIQSTLHHQLLHPHATGWRFQIHPSEGKHNVFSQPIFSRHRPHWHRTSTFFMTSITVLQCQWFRKCKRPWQKHLVAQFSLHSDNLSTIPLPPLECVIGVMYTSECTRRGWISQTTFSNNFPITEGDFYSALETTVMNSTSNRIKLYLWMPLRTISKGFGAVKHWW